MKIALVHDWLNTKHGGAEQTLLELAAAYPKAPIYTMIFNESKFGELIKPERVRTSWLNKLPKALKRNSRYLLPFIPSALKGWDFNEFDVVISNSSAFVKNIKIGPRTTHICYCNSPMRFAWDYWPNYLDEQQVGPLRRTVIPYLVNYMRRWDLKGSQGVDYFIANSKTVQARIKKYYQREAEVIYPPVTIPQLPVRPSKSDFYLTLSILTPYKKLDLAIEAFNISGKKLVILSDGPDRKRLEGLAAPNIEFKGYVDAVTRDNLISVAKGLIYPNIEDFGIAPVEAQALGTPVIAYREGGVTESVVDGQTGVLFNQQTPEAINQAVEKAEKTVFDPKVLHAQALKFDRSRFLTEIKQFIEEHHDKPAR